MVVISHRRELLASSDGYIGTGMFGYSYPTFATLHHKTVNDTERLDESKREGTADIFSRGALQDRAWFLHACFR